MCGDRSQDQLEDLGIVQRADGDLLDHPVIG
jgi:hypothetical protein